MICNLTLYLKRYIIELQFNRTLSGKRSIKLVVRHINRAFLVIRYFPKCLLALKAVRYD